MDIIVIQSSIPKEFINRRSEEELKNDNAFDIGKFLSSSDYITHKTIHDDKDNIKMYSKLHVVTQEEFYELKQLRRINQQLREQIVRGDTNV